MTTPEISVVVPFFESEAHIGACIEALLHPRPHVDAELVFVDNRSPDGSAGLVRQHPAVTLLEEPEPGAYAARNRGIAATRAPIVAFTDADCVVAPDWLDQIRRAFADPATAIVVGHCAYPPHASRPLRWLAAYENAKTEHVLTRGRPAQRFVYANNMAVRATVFEAIGPFQQWARAADTELAHRLHAYRPDLHVRYRDAMRVTHHEFTKASARAARLTLYTQTNTQVASFRELGLLDRARVVGHALRRVWPPREARD